MTVKFNRAAASTFFSAPDHTGLTIPASPTTWALGILVCFDGLTTGDNPQHLISTKSTGQSGAFNLVYQTEAAATSHRNRLTMYFNTLTTPTLVTVNDNRAGDKWLFVFQQTGTTVTVRRCPILANMPSDGSAVVADGTAERNAVLNGSGLWLGARANLTADKMCDQSLGRVFFMADTLTDLEVAKLAHGMEVTDLDKSPLWYARLDNADDFVNRGSLPIAFTKNGDITTSESQPAFGYSAPAKPMINDAPTIIGGAVGQAASYTPAEAINSAGRTQEWYVSGVLVSTASTYTPVVADAGKNLLVRQVEANAAGSVSADSAPVTITAVATDTTLPTFQGNLAASVTVDSITVSWATTASADNVAVARHEYRIGGAGPYVAASAAEEAGKSHTFSSLAGDTPYRVDVRCVDTSGNASAPLSLDARTIGPEHHAETSITDEDFVAWLASDDAITNILVETWALVDGVRTPFFWSTNGYTTEGTNNPVFYAPVVGVSIPFTEALSLTSTASLSAGDIEIDNTNGMNEHLAGYIWADDVLAVVGDVRWARADYRPIFVGHSVGLVRKGPRAFALRLRDMMEGLNYPISERKFGGAGVNADTLIPLTFGECCNASGEWSNTSTLERQWHDGPIEGIVETRANGIPISEQVIVSESTGKSLLTVNNESATITATVQGDKFGGVFRKTIATLIERLITGYGKDVGRYTLANIDTENFAQFDATHPQSVGLHVRERLNVIEACTMLTSSVGAQLAPSLDGKLQLIQIALPAAGPAMEIRAEHMVDGTLRHVQHIDPIAAVKLGYCRNWTAQPGMQSNLPAEHKGLFEKEWPLTVTRVDEDIKRKYKLDGDPVMRATMLLRGDHAAPEAERELALWGPGRDIYEFDGIPDLLMLKKGQRLIVYHEQDGMIAGVEAQVIEIQRDWWTRTVTVRFLK